jgi:hypothetical protein
MAENPQPTPATAEKKSRGLGSYVVWAFVAVMVYVLSSGPMILNVGLTSKWYSPLVWAYTDTPLHRPIGLYWHLWWPEMFDRGGGYTFDSE